MSSQIEDLPETKLIPTGSEDIDSEAKSEAEHQELMRIQREERERQWREQAEAAEEARQEAERLRLEAEEKAREEWKALMEELDVYDAALMASNLILIAAYIIGLIGVALIILGWFVAQTDNAGAMVMLAGISLIMAWMCLVSVGGDLQKDNVRLHPKCVSYYAEQKRAEALGSQDDSKKSKKSSKRKKKGK